MMRHARIERIKDPNPGSVSTAFGLALRPESTSLPSTVSLCLVTRSHSFSGAQGAHRFRNISGVSLPEVVRQQVDYCAYGHMYVYMKPTHIWSNMGGWVNHF